MVRVWNSVGTAPFAKRLNVSSVRAVEYHSRDVPFVSCVTRSLARFASGDPRGGEVSKTRNWRAAVRRDMVVSLVSLRIACGHSGLSHLCVVHRVLLGVTVGMVRVWNSVSTAPFAKRLNVASVRAVEFRF